MPFLINEKRAVMPGFPGGERMISELAGCKCENWRLYNADKGYRVIDEDDVFWSTRKGRSPF